MDSLITAKNKLVHIMACPRSGTQYITKVLNVAGLKVAHEKIGEDGCVNFFYYRQIRPKIVMHQTRNPLEVIPSLTTIQDEWHRGFSLSAGLKPEDLRTIEGAAFLWVDWVERIERCVPDFTYKIEDVETQWQNICDLLNIKRKTFPLEVQRTIRNKHKWQTGASWGDLGAAKNAVAEKAIKYGYKV